MDFVFGVSVWILCLESVSVCEDFVFGVCVCGVQWPCAFTGCGRSF